MTCLLNTFGKISNLDNIIQFLSQTGNPKSFQANLNKNFKDNSLNDDEEEFKEFDNHNKDDNWSSDNWVWKNEKQTSKKPQEPKNKNKDADIAKNENWFDSFCFSLSPCGNLFAIGDKRSVVICKPKWDDNNHAKFTVSSRIDLADLEDEYITSIICVPIASQKISGEGFLDWTCIIIGFSSGNIRMFTENGTLLITQMFHDEKVVKLKCRTYEPVKYIGWISQPEEIEILYENNVLVCIDGANFYHYLRAARKYAAISSKDQYDMTEAFSSLNLDYKKWKFESVEKLSDFVGAGLASENKFDQLFSASVNGGPYEKFESIPPMLNRYLACGNSPFVSFYYAFDTTPLPFQEVKAVASKVTSALMNVAKGWMGFGKSTPATPTKPKIKIEPPTDLTSRYSFRDHRRNGESIIIAPANNLAATTDSFARVILIDVLRGTVVRVFKGYRDAQIGWVCVEDESEEKTNKRYALYLIIYAPRRGLLEVWGCQQGIRVAAFNVGKNAKLIFPGYFMLTLNGSLSNSEFKLSQQIQCFLIDSEGVIKTIQIPFHLILSDKSNQRVRDTILLKKLKSILKEQNEETESLWNNLNIILNDFKTATIKQEALERLINTNYLSPNKVNQIIHQELDQIEKQGNNLSIETFKLGQFCRFNCKLINSYIFVLNLSIKKNDENDDDLELSNLSQLTKIDENDLKNYFEMKKAFYRKRKSDTTKKKVKFTNENDSNGLLSLSQYISCFEFLSNTNNNTNKQQENDNNNLLNSLNDYSQSRYFQLKASINIQDKITLSRFLFTNLLSKQNDFDKDTFKSFLRTIPLRKINLFDLLANAWLTNSEFENISSLYKMLFILSGCEKYKKNIKTAHINIDSQSTITTDRNFDVRSTISEQSSSTCITSKTSETLASTVTTKSDDDTKTIKEENYDAKEEMSDDEEFDYEYEDFENTFVFDYIPKFQSVCESSSSLNEALLLNWIVKSILVESQIETNFIETLNILSDRLVCLIKLSLLCLCGQKSILDSIEPSSFNLKTILSKGKGILSEIVSKNIVLNELSPKLIIFDEEDSVEQVDNNASSLPHEAKDEYESMTKKKLCQNEIFQEFYDTLQETRNYLPKSLEPDILLVNCAWESILLYIKDVEADIKYLDLSLKYCGEIGNAILKQGILSMIWHNHLSKRVSLLTDLIDKVGKLPKDRLIRKEVGINENSVVKFLECVMTLLDLIMDANCSINEVPIFNYDQFWKDHIEYNEMNLIPTNLIINNSIMNSLNGSKNKSIFSNISFSKQLVESAAEQKHVNYYLCLFHYQLIRILYLIIKYNIKSAKPLSFFDTKGKHTLFSELHTHPLISNDVDIKILNARKLFLTKSINAIMENVDNPISVKSKLSKEVSDNLNIVFNLSKDLGVDFEYISRYYCCVLYALDYHSEAEKILHTIKETELVASQLLVVVGSKVNEILEANFDANLVAILSTNLSSWLKSLGRSEYKIYTLQSKQALLELMGTVLNKLPDTFSEYKIAVELLEFIENSQFQIK